MIILLEYDISNADLHLSFFLIFIYLFIFLTLQYCIGFASFAIYQHDPPQVHLLVLQCV